MYPITVDPWDIDNSEEIGCVGLSFGEREGECIAGNQQSFLRLTDSPKSLIPPGWVAERFLASDPNGGPDYSWQYTCPACVAETQRQIEADDYPQVRFEFGDITLHNVGQYSNESGTGRDVYGNPQFFGETYGQNLQALSNEADAEYQRMRRDFDVNQHRRPNLVERKAIDAATGKTEKKLDIDNEMERSEKFLKKLNISIPERKEDEEDGEYIDRLHSLIPKDYFKEKSQLLTRQELKEQAKKLYKNNPEHLRLVLEQIDKEERHKRTYSAILREMHGKKRTRDDKDGDGSGKDPRKKSKKKGGRRKLRRKTKRKKRKKKKRTKRKKKTKRRR